LDPYISPFFFVDFSFFLFHHLEEKSNGYYGVGKNSIEEISNGYYGEGKNSIEEKSNGYYGEGKNSIEEISNSGGGRIR
jgi:hypothetical protein